LGERFNGIEEVVGSIPSGSTNSLLNMNRYQKSCGPLVAAWRQSDFQGGLQGGLRCSQTRI
jgi:hypothetical protein